MSAVPASQLHELHTAPALVADPRPGTRALERTALHALGIELVDCAPDRVIARMTSDGSRSFRSQLLVLAETTASTAAGLAAGPTRRAFGTELNASVIATPAPGTIIAVAVPWIVDEDRHVWRIAAHDSTGARVLESRCTLSIVEAAPAG